jgi:HEPN domain-containing protein
MRTPEQVRWDFVQDWLRKANADLEASRILVEEDLDDYEVAAFHAQQAAEKLVKAYLVRHQVEFSKTHEIRALRSLVASIDAALAGELAEADDLTPYAVEYRYPGDAGGVSHEDAAEALKVAKRIQARVLAALGDYLRAGRPQGPPEGAS